jgi:hypothetical protein
LEIAGELPEDPDRDLDPSFGNKKGAESMAWAEYCTPMQCRDRAMNPEPKY